MNNWIKYDVFKYLSMLLGYMYKPQYKWLSAIVYPLAQLWRGSSNLVGWDAYRKRKFHESNITGQTLSLQEYLNNELDNTERRISIIHKHSLGLDIPLVSEGYLTIEVSLISESKAIYVGLEGELELELGTGFIVLIPSSVNKDLAMGIVNEYKLAGKAFRVEIN